MSKSPAKNATLYRMVMPEHVCPYGLKARHLLHSEGYAVDDHWLKTREETDVFKAAHSVATTPQTFIAGDRIGTYDDLRRFFGQHVSDPEVPSYRPVVTVFICALLMALAALVSVHDLPMVWQALRWFVAFSMCILALLKLQDVESFSTMFLNYDLLARRWIPYAYIYPFAEFLAGALMISGRLPIIAIPMALVIGSIGAISVFKAVYVDHRELKCACAGGASNVPLGFVSMTENLMMVGMGIWMLVDHVVA